MATPSNDKSVVISMGGGNKESGTSAETKISRGLGSPKAAGFFPPPVAYPSSAYPPPQAGHGCPPPQASGHGCPPPHAGHGCPPPAYPSYCPPHGGYPWSYGCPPPTYPPCYGGYHGYGGYWLVPGGYYHRPPACYHHHYSGDFRKHHGHSGGKHMRFYGGFSHGNNKWK